MADASFIELSEKQHQVLGNMRRDIIKPMNRTIHIIRHAKSVGGRHDQLSFGPKGSPLDELGVEQSKLLKIELSRLGIDPATSPVASSATNRSYETAEIAGFKHITEYSSLNGIDSNLSPEKLDALIARKEASPQAIAAAKKLLANPPPEDIWITHGQLITGIAYVLNIPTSKLFIPELGTVSKIVLP